MPLSIRCAAESDVPAILDLVRQLAEHQQMAHTVTATEDRLREALFGERPAAEVLLADWEGDSAGVAIFFATYSTFRAQRGIYLEDLYVKPHLRGRGVGLALLREVARIAVQRGCARVDWTVLEWNQPSIRFYEKLGAEPVRESIKYRLTGESLDRLASAAPGA